jgi:hypothetical protein
MTEAELKKLSKVKIEEYARTQGIELDRRKTKAGMIAEFFDKHDIPDNNSKVADEKAPIEVKYPDEVAFEKEAAKAQVVNDAQLTEFNNFIKDLKSEDVGNPTMWMLGALGKYIVGHKVKCTKDPETGKVIIESSGPSINGKFELK